MDEPVAHHLSRRGFLGGVIGAAGATALAPGLLGLDQAWAGAPGSGRLDDVRHVVILMQENRSFDHYFGQMAGVRGFGDRAALVRPDGSDVFGQPDPARTDGGVLRPFHIDTRLVDGQDLADLPHDWNSTHRAFADGRNDGWVAAKSEMTMGYFTGSDIPFQRALAKAFTIGDNYFCSLAGPTTPNRLYHWTGTIDPEGRAGGPVAANPGDYLPLFTWTTYPERLQAAGVSWQVYANDEVGDGPDGFVGDFGDNPLWLFRAYHDALASTDPSVRRLAERAGLRTTWKPDSGQGRSTDHVLAQFLADCRAGTLPAVSWVVAPYLYSEHPAARPVDGAAYLQTMLTALWADRELRDSTVVIINYDENDGFFDHLPPPVAPPGTPQEFLPADQPGFRGPRPAAGPPVPIGLGPRVPLTVVSPWSRGGFVNSQVFDHTSVLRFLEVWTGVREPNISAWRRAICGDLTSCFDFDRVIATTPGLPDAAALPDAGALRVRADRTQTALPTPAPPPPGAQVTPRQEPGVAPARPLPYQAVANVAVGTDVRVEAANLGTAALQLAIYANHVTPVAVQHVDVAARGRAAAVVAAAGDGRYDLRVHGPNGFLRLAAGDAASTAARVAVTVTPAGPPLAPSLRLAVVNDGTGAVTVTIGGRGAGPGAGSVLTVPAGRTVVTEHQPFMAEHGWYDLSVALAGHPSFVRRFAGHLENGLPSVTG